MSEHHITTEHHLRVSRTARYFVLGTASATVREVWIVLHGYGNSAEHFLRAFRTLDDGTRLIVAPEALSRFYIEGTKGHVGATWMTRADRDHEIADYIAYLDRLAALVFESIDRQNVKLVVLGFSQGTATATRWCCNGAHVADAVVLWGGNVAPEIDVSAYRERLRNLHLVLGTRDEYRDDALVIRERERLDVGGVAYTTVEYDGTHRIEAEPLNELINRIAQREN